MVVQVPPPEKFYEYAIRYNGTGYTSSLVQIYVQGAPVIQSVRSFKTFSTTS